MLETITCYKLDVTTLEKLFLNYFKDNYNYIPKIELSLKKSFFLPISLKIIPEISEAFRSFYIDFKSTTLSLKKKIEVSNEVNDDTELGDKLLQLCLNKKTLEYISSSKGILVLIDEENTLEFDEDKKHQMTNVLKEKFDIFKIEHEDFERLFTEKIKLINCTINSFNCYIYLEVEHKEDVKCVVRFQQSYGISNWNGILNIRAHCHKKRIFKDLNFFADELIDIIFNNISLKKENVYIDKRIELYPFKVDYNG